MAFGLNQNLLITGVTLITATVIALITYRNTTSHRETNALIALVATCLLGLVGKVVYDKHHAALSVRGRTVDIESFQPSANTVLDPAQFGLVKNPLSENDITWTTNPTDSFSAKNWPNTLDFEGQTKRHVFEISKTLPLNYGIIDCGAHIGDAAIPIAEALRSSGRSDITVYAIDPSPDKCVFISHVAELNGLTNIKVLCCGLSDTDGQVYTYAADENWVDSNNTGGIRWHDVNGNEETATGREQITFFTLDTLRRERLIEHPIGFIHLDVEDMEPEAIRGGFHLINSFGPVLSCEALSTEAESKILQELDKIPNRRYAETRRHENNIVYEPQ